MLKDQDATVRKAADLALHNINPSKLRGSVTRFSQTLVRSEASRRLVINHLKVVEGSPSLRRFADLYAAPQSAREQKSKLLRQLANQGQYQQISLLMSQD